MEELSNWIEEQIPERTIDPRVLQLHSKQIAFYQTIRAENFIEELQQLWDTSSGAKPKLENEIQQDWLHYAIQMCNDKLPANLPELVQVPEFAAENAIAFALYQVTYD